MPSGTGGHSTENPRTYGRPPFRAAVIHGGPGAPGEMAPVARELALVASVLEPFQTAESVEGQIEELKAILQDNTQSPVTLIGFSWGAWLSVLLAAKHPDIVNMLLLVGSGPFEEKYAGAVQETRLARLNESDWAKLKSLMEALEGAGATKRTRAFARLGEIASKADAFDPICQESEVIEWQPHVFRSVWDDAAKLRRQGKLLESAGRIQCPVVAIHGDYDPHPAEGVQRSLSTILKNFRFILLKNCGHRPWMERHARVDFFRVLREEVRQV